MREKIIKGVQEMTQIPYFPKEEYAQRAIMTEISRFADRADGLDWLFATAARSMKQWGGVAELRGLYCTRFKPADGHDPGCSVPGYSANDCEGAYIAERAKETDRILLGWKQQQKLIGEQPTVIDVTPAVKLIDPPSKTQIDLKAKTNRESLASVLKASAAPIRIPATPKRTPEQHAEEIRKLQAELESRRA